MGHRNGFGVERESKTILVRLLSPRAGSEAGMEKSYLTVNSHEATTVKGVSVKDCCLGSLENTKA